jgi:hypothetical protein
MPKPFDATLKDLIQSFPMDWLSALGIAAAEPVRVLSPDLSTVTAASDIVLRTGDTLLHVDFQASSLGDLHRRTLFHNTLLHYRYGLPVHSIIVLLRRQARHSNITGRVEYSARAGKGALQFQYEVVSLWERPPEQFLAGRIGVVPLAVLGQLPPGVRVTEALSPVIDRLVRRVLAELRPKLRQS